MATRAKNRTTHPGEIINKDKIHRRSSDEVRTERKIKEAAAHEARLKQIEALKNVAAKEDQQLREDGEDFEEMHLLKAALEKITPDATEATKHAEDYSQYNHN